MTENSDNAASEDENLIRVQHAVVIQCLTSAPLGHPEVFS